MLVIVLGVLSFGSIGTAASTSLVINEVDYDQPGTDAAEFLELLNVSGSSVNLDAYRVELVNGSGGAVYQTFDLPNVELAAGDYFVACANPATTANCDFDASTTDTNLIQNGAPDGLRLMLDTTVVDALSYEGDTAGATEGSGAGLEDTAVGGDSISRCPDGLDADVNNADFVLVALSPGAANSCPEEPTQPLLVVNEIDYDQPGTDGAEFVEIKNVGTTAANLGGVFLDFVNGNGGVVYASLDLPAVDLAAGDYFVVCGNAATTANCDLDVLPDTNLIQNGSPDAMLLREGEATLDTVSYAGSTEAPYTEGSGEGLVDSSTAADVGISRCADGVDTNVNNVDFAQRPITPGATNSCVPPPPPPAAFGVCGDRTETRISAVQGPDLATPVPGEIRVVEGVVVGDYQAVGGFNGYYLQEETGDADDNAATSEGIFVFSGSLAGGALDVSAGQIVRVRGTVSEFSGLTQIGTLTNAAVCPGTADIPPTPVTLPVSAVADHERTEGMKVRLVGLTVTEVFNLGRFGEVSLSGVGRLPIPTSVALPGAPAQAVMDANNRSRIILDDGDNRQNIDPTVYPQGSLSATNTLRVGDTLAELNGVMDFRFGAYRIQPVGPVAFSFTNPRTSAPAAVGGNLKVTSFNVLNYFNGDGAGGGFPTSRGAETQAELDRQQAKIVSALTTIDADIMGLMEIENDGGANSALSQLTAALNAATAPGTYAYVDTGVIGTDAIKVAVIYKPGVVTPVGAYAVLTSAADPRFVDTLNRPSLAQTFRHNASGQTLTVLVNHLKSKGSACGGDPDTGDGSGNCNQTRTNAAEAIVDWLAGDPTGSGDPDFLIIGDLNSYTFETPIQALEAGGFTNLVRAYGGLDAYSYVFNGESGYLDHALSTASLAEQVTGVTEWHVNPDEPSVLDYNTNFKSPNHQTTLYDPGPYRSSDHDPVIVGLQLNRAPDADAGGPYTVAEGGSVAIAATGSDPDGDAVTYAWDLDDDGAFDDGAGQTASFSAATIDGPAVRTVRVQVSDGALQAVDSAIVNVTNVAPTASFHAPSSAFAGFAFTLSLTNATDAAPADVPGLTFAFDCGGGYGAFSAGRSTACPTDSVGLRSVGAKVRDDDGGVTEYRRTVAVRVTFDSLCNLVRSYVDRRVIAAVLCLQLHEAADSRGRHRNGHLNAFVHLVRAQSGRSMTAAEAATLIRLAGALQR